MIKYEKMLMQNLYCNKFKQFLFMNAKTAPTFTSLQACFQNTHVRLSTRVKHDFLRQTDVSV